MAQTARIAQPGTKYNITLLPPDTRIARCTELHHTPRDWHLGSETGNYGKVGMGVNPKAGDVQQLVFLGSGYFVYIYGCTLSQTLVILLTDNPERCVQPPNPAKGIYYKDAGVVAIGDRIAVHRRSV